MQLIDRFFQEPERNFFLFGPRGTGKSTLLQAHFPDALWIEMFYVCLVKIFYGNYAQTNLFLCDPDFLNTL